jgi:hypothetical protein
VDGEPGGIDAVGEDGLVDEVAGERAGLASRQAPCHHAAAVEVDGDVEAEVAALEGREPGDVPGPDLVRAGGDEDRLRVGGVRGDPPPLPDRPFSRRIRYIELGEQR